ncbi:hypothetical protein VTN96DRAFT_10281 [Rasamsonia emersonii]
MYVLFEDLPLTLEHLVACDAYPSEIQLASILAQVLSSLSYLTAAGFEHRSLISSNILLGLDGVIQIAALEDCHTHLLDQTQAQAMKALATITMELMQKYVKDDGVIGVDDVERWPVDSDAVGFLSATTSAGSIEELKGHALITKRRCSRGELVDLARFALISARTFYSYTP